jgi:hypothetical protein
MVGEAVVRIIRSYKAGDEVAPVASLSDFLRNQPQFSILTSNNQLTVLVIAEFKHEFVESFGVFSQVESSLFYTI